MVLDSLTSLRLFAAAVVVFLHTGLLLAPLLPDPQSYGRVVFAGPTGVNFFFILSGFVLTWSSRSPGDRATDFFRRRTARVLPNHVLTWIATVALLLCLGASLSPGAVITALFLVHAWIPNQHYFGAADTPSWSLSCEAFFYLLFPLLLVGLRRLSSRSRRVIMVVAVVVPLAAAVAQPHLAGHFSVGAQNWIVDRFPVTRLAEFALGVLLALEAIDGRWLTVPIPLAAALSIGALALVDVLDDPRWLVIVTLVPFALLITSAARSDAAAHPSVLRHRWLVRGGQWSYALYLVHWPVLIGIGRLYKHPFANELETAVGVLVIFAICLTVAGLVFTTWERPWEGQIRRDRRPPAPLRPLGTTPGPAQATAPLPAQDASTSASASG